jgi:hypothetical protein
MPRHRSRKWPVPHISIKRPLRPGLFQMTAQQITEMKEVITAKKRRDALYDLMGVILIGPPGAFPIKPSTGASLFGLSVDRLAKYEPKTAAALLLCAAYHSRLELFALTLRKAPNKTLVAIAKAQRLLCEKQTYSHMRDCLDAFRRALGKRTCYPRTLRRQDELLRAYARSHKYPIGTRAERDKRRKWVHEHLSGMIAEAQTVACLHEWRSLTDDDRDAALNAITANTSPAQLSALVLTLLHPVTVDSLLKRLLPRHRL